jgi:Tol biopolymer transport system component/tRNA A-37 threonylcarbamoyl transferase component Bud32
MGEVYKARDTRLERDVAIKIVWAGLAADPAALARFEREARAIGALNHPNVVNVFDIGSENGTTYVVMELVEGQTLRAALVSADGSPQPLPRKKACDLAQQIAQGLAAAHARGIVHRDLKPENVLIGRDGRVRIVDFGLARSLPETLRQSGDVQTALSPAGASVHSGAGLVVGTAGYMAPEQVYGEAADQRCDIFALGCVLFEMLTGTRAFDGRSPIETMSAVLNKDPLEQQTAAALSGPMEWVVRRCLEKQPDERFQSARDLAFQLQAVASGTLSGAANSTPAPARRATKPLLIVAVVCTVIAAFVLGRQWPSGPVVDAQTTMFDVQMPSGLQIALGNNPAHSGGLAVSPDGRRLAFTAAPFRGSVQIYVRDLDSTTVRPVPGTVGGLFPAWSPDARRLVFAQSGEWRQISAEGGTAATIATTRLLRSRAAWGDDDTLLFHGDFRGALMRVPLSGGAPLEVLPGSPEANFSWYSPVWLPGSRRFLVVRFAYDDAHDSEAGIYVGSVESKAVTRVVGGRVSELSLADGHIVYRIGSQLIAQPFDPRQARVTGPPRVISDHVSAAGAGGRTLAYVEPRDPVMAAHRITWRSREGTIVGHLGEPGTFRDPRLSRDGRWLAIARANDFGLFSAWVYDTERGTESKISDASHVSPMWTSDGSALLIGDANKVMRFDLAGGPGQVVRSVEGDVVLAGVTPAGDHVVGALTRGDSEGWLADIPLDSGAATRRLATVGFSALSADGRWLAYTVTEAGESHLYAQRLSGGRRIPIVRGSYPVWSRDARELFYVVIPGYSAIGVVPVSWKNDEPDFGKPATLFTVPHLLISNGAFDVSADGQRFVMVEWEEPEAAPLTVRIQR